VSFRGLAGARTAFNSAEDCGMKKKKKKSLSLRGWPIYVVKTKD